MPTIRGCNANLELQGCTVDGGTRLCTLHLTCALNGHEGALSYSVHFLFFACNSPKASTGCTTFLCQSNCFIFYFCSADGSVYIIQAALERSGQSSRSQKQQSEPLDHLYKTVGVIADWECTQSILGQTLEIEFDAMGLESGSTYRLRVVGHMIDNIPLTLGERAFHTPPTTPGSPSPPAVLSITRNSLRIRWGPPRKLNGGSLCGYQLHMTGAAHLSSATSIEATGQQDYALFTGVYQGSECEFLAEGLKPGCDYTLKCAAINEIGRGPWCKSTTFRTAPSVPGTPNPPVVLDATTSSVTVGWAPALQTNGSRVTSYLLEMDDCLANTGSSNKPQSKKSTAEVAEENGFGSSSQFKRLFDGMQFKYEITELPSGSHTTIEEE